jgi:hypothetical protein
MAPPVCRESPAGKAPAARLNEYGGVPPAAETEVVYGVPGLPLGSVVAVTESGPAIAMLKLAEAAIPLESVPAKVKL